MAHPPRPFIPCVMKRAVVGDTEWHGPIIAGLSPHSPRLSKAEMVRLAGTSATDQARQGGNVAQVLFVAESLGFRDSQSRIINTI